MAAMKHRNGSKSGQVLALTLRYQHNHPEYKRIGVKAPGRINVEERYHYTEGVAKIFIKDKKLLKIVTSKGAIKDIDKSRAINRYFLKKHNGDYKKAKAEVHRIVEMLKEVNEKARYHESEYMQHIAKHEGIPDAQFKEYHSESVHVVASAITLIWSYFQEAELII